MRRPQCISSLPRLVTRHDGRRPSRRGWVLGIGTLLVGCLLVSSSAKGQDSGSSEVASPPNIVVMIADDLGWDDLGCYGNPGVRTPNIDRLAEDGVRYDAAFLTCSSCSPSRTSILTGRYPHATGASQLHQPVPAEQILVSTPLREAGYYTAAVGKWHLGPAVQEQFDLVKQGGGPGAEEFWVPVLRDRPRDQPFFLWLAATDPHRDYAPGTLDPPHDPADVVVPPYFPDTPEVRADLAAYYDEIGRFDKYVGLVMEELERQGVADSTLVIIMTDNGRPFPSCKTRVTANGVKTPLVMRWPGHIEPSTASNSLVSSIDLAPTFLELAGVEIGETFQGVSLVPTFDDPTAQVREYAFAEHNWHDYQSFERAIISLDGLLVINECPHLPPTPPADAVRSPTYVKMMEMYADGLLNEVQSDVFRAPRGRTELFLWRQDSQCIADQADQPEHESLQQRLHGALLQWQAETNDSFPGIDQLRPDKYDRRTGRLPEGN
ncbi:MAG: sulfatase [Pirellulaceae bacterium]